MGTKPGLGPGTTARLLGSDCWVGTPGPPPGGSTRATPGPRMAVLLSPVPGGKPGVLTTARARVAQKSRSKFGLL